jgi:hypothetical protein
MSKSWSSDHIYYNVRINGNANNTLQVCNYQEQRTIPLVDNPSNYYFSCIKFSIPTSSIPLMVVPIDGFPNTDMSKTVYSVSLSYNGFSSAQTFIKWIPTQSNSASATYRAPKRQLSASTPFLDPEDNYYYCNSYTYFMSLVNIAYEDAFNDLSGQTTLPAGAVAPFYTYNAPTKLFTINAQEAFYDVNHTAQPIEIYQNYELWNLFGAVSNFTYNDPVIAGNDKQILITADTANVDASGYILFQQEYVSLYNFMAFRSIVVCSSTVPLISEGIPSVSKNFTPDNEQIGSSAYLPIISSFDALTDSNAYESFQSSIQYAPTGPYKLIDMIGSNPLSSFDLQVYWMDIYGGLHNLLLNPHESATFTFLFQKKGI